jgi:predicted dehydrogenase
MQKVAVVGFGFMGLTHTMQILKSKKLQLTAIVEKNPDRIEKTLSGETGNFPVGSLNADDIRHVPVYQDLEDCLSKEGIDNVHICAHTILHVPLTRIALQAGKNVLLEKPMCLIPEEGQQLIELARKKGKTFMVGHVLRFKSVCERVKNLIESGEHGALEIISCYRYAGVPSWGDWKTDASVRQGSGGALFDLLIHDIDFLQNVLGRPSCIRAELLPGIMSEHDLVFAVWEFPNSNTRAVVHGGYPFHSNTPFEAGLWAKFERATVKWHSIEAGTLLVIDDMGIEEIDVRDPGPAHEKEIEYFAQCVEERIPPSRCMPESSLQAVQLCHLHVDAGKFPVKTEG